MFMGGSEDIMDNLSEANSPNWFCVSDISYEVLRTDLEGTRLKMYAATKIASPRI